MKIRSAYDIIDYSSYIRNAMRKEVQLTMHNCQVCNKPDSEKPMAFRNMPWCSENHRKKIQGDEPTKKF